MSLGRFHPDISPIEPDCDARYRCCRYSNPCYFGALWRAKILSTFSARSTAPIGSLGHSGFNSTRLYPPLVLVVHSLYVGIGGEQGATYHTLNYRHPYQPWRASACAAALRGGEWSGLKLCVGCIRGAPSFAAMGAWWLMLPISLSKMYTLEFVMVETSVSTALIVVVANVLPLRTLKSDNNTSVAPIFKEYSTPRYTSVCVCTNGRKMIPVKQFFREKMFLVKNVYCKKLFHVKKCFL